MNWGYILAAVDAFIALLAVWFIAHQVRAYRQTSRRIDDLRDRLRRELTLYADYHSVDLDKKEH